MLGNNKKQFDRLLKELDSLVENKKIKEDILAQIGHSTYKPKNYKYYTFVEDEKHKSNLEKADMIIAHAGCGCIIEALSRNKPIIIVPRRTKYDEHVNDHQFEITKVLEENNEVIVANDVKDLYEAYKKAKGWKSKRKQSKNRLKALSSKLEDYFNTIK